MLYERVYSILRAKEAIGREAGHLAPRFQKLLNWLRRRYAQ
jgi:hypothetical protein